jgi:diadenylate cyclase
MELFRIVFIPFTVIDVLDITAVAFLLYRLYKFFRKSSLIQLLVLLVGVFILVRVVELLHMELLDTLLTQFLQIGLLALVVIFGPELRRAFLGFSRNTILERLRRQIGGKDLPREDDIREIVEALTEMSGTRMGSIIVLEGNTSLASYAATGDGLNAAVSKRLLVSIFNPKSPLHDGGVLVRGNSIIAARVVLPVSDDPDLPPELGLRHRSALGITEVSDAAALISSEESGKISVAYEGRLKRNLSADELTQFMRSFYDVEAPTVA